MNMSGPWDAKLGTATSPSSAMAASETDSVLAEIFITLFESASTIYALSIQNPVFEISAGPE